MLIDDRVARRQGPLPVQFARGGNARALRVSALALIAAGALLVASCGGGGGATDSTSVGGLVTATGNTKVLTRLQVSAPATALLVGEHMTATAAGYDQYGAKMPVGAPVWASSAPAAATVDAGGVITATGAGETTISASVDGQQGTASLTVLLAPVARIVLAPSVAPLGLAATQQITATLLDDRGNVLSGRAVSWSSSAPAVASVSANGLITALTEGAAVITATSGGVQSTVPVTITTHFDPVARVVIAPTAGSVSFGHTLQLALTLLDAAGNTLVGRGLVWSVSDPAIARVSATGVVTPLGVGTVQVTATSEGKSATVAVTVRADVVVSILNPDSTTVSGDTLYVAALAKSALPVDGAVALVGQHEEPLVRTRIGALGGLEAWVAHIVIRDLYWGPNAVTVIITDTNGGTGVTTVPFTYDPQGVKGGIIPPRKDKELVPAVKKRVP